MPGSQATNDETGGEEKEPGGGNSSPGRLMEMDRRVKEWKATANRACCVLPCEYSAATIAYGKEVASWFDDENLHRRYTLFSVCFFVTYPLR